MTNFVAIITIISLLESNDNSKAVGDNGQAIGKYQIHKEYVQDVNRIYGTSYQYPRDALDPVIAPVIVKKYLTYYGSKIEKPNITTFLRIHNGGPRGNEKQKTLAYVQRARNYINFSSIVR